MRALTMPRRLVLLSLLILIAAVLDAGADPRCYAVEAGATVQENPPRIDFTWRYDGSATEYWIFRKAPGDTAWTGPLAHLDGHAASWSDTDVAVGEAWEYAFRKTLDFQADTVQVVAGRPLTFTIRDSWGDGICCQHGLGRYEVSADGVIYAEGGAFGLAETTAFSAGQAGEPPVDLVVSLVLDVFGQETTWTLTDEVTSATLAAGGPYDNPRFGHVLAGIRAPAVEDRGAMLLVLDSDITYGLAAEIDRLEVDLIADGYRVRRLVVWQALAPAEVKAMIAAACRAEPDIATLFLLGHVPVPYSGDLRGVHTNHQGAWPADVYYGELDGPWTDESVDNTTAAWPANHNVPGDGKFDQTWLPSDVDLALGRVDLWDMPAFWGGDQTLLRRYLDKDHAWRRGESAAEARGLIDDNVGDAYGLAFAATGWRNFAVMFGHENTHSLDYLSTLAAESHLWSYGCGGGSFTSCAGIGQTADFAEQPLLTVFTMLYGSYFGDWNVTDCILRAPLAAEGLALTCCWGGRPTWHFHPMALGYTAGYCARLTQNNDHLYTVADGGRQIHIALMGDPTLRMHVARPVSDLALALSPAGEVQLSWTPPPGQVEGYHVYRAPGLREAFVRLSIDPILELRFVDAAPLAGTNVYMVRALRLETSASGTYLNLSAGTIDSLDTATSAPSATPPGRCELAPAFPNPFNPEATIRYRLASDGWARLRICAVDGRRVRTLVDGRQAAGWRAAAWDGRDDAGRSVAAGVYLCVLEAGRERVTRRLTLVK
ncbi:MAG: hypothetical protein JW819_08145 [Candidatus Krumholzibacteriota bacterium]|nr:hypothetical protein [Candidatus Krumholzibacteriota bacterium]